MSKLAKYLIKDLKGDLSKPSIKFFRSNGAYGYVVWLIIINSNFESNGGYYLFALRMSPLFPFFIINICFGLTKMKLIPFYIISQIGMLPGTVLIILVGRELSNTIITGNLFNTELIIYLSIFGILPLLFKKIFNTI